MNRNAIIGIVVVLVVLVGGFMLFKNMQTPDQGTPAAPTDQSTQATSAPAMTDTTASGAATTGTVKEVTISGSNLNSPLQQSPSTKATPLKSLSQIPEECTMSCLMTFSAGSKTIQSGATDTFQFVADKAGTFQYYCSVGNHKAMGMVGTLTVQ